MLVFFVSCAVISYILLFFITIYAQTHTFSCPTGPIGPQGAHGPIGNTGAGASTSTSYLHGNSLAISLKAPATPISQPLPSTGIPYKTLAKNGDNAIFSWDFIIDQPTSEVEKQTKIKLEILGGTVFRPFRTNDIKQTISLAWLRPPLFSNQSLNITGTITRNSDTSIIITAIFGLQWNITGSPKDNGIENIFCTDINFNSENIFLQPKVFIPIDSGEEIVTISSTVNVFKN
jgi:hypothetical protein